MFVHHIAYRHENGDIEEFVGSGLTPSSARQNSVFAAKAAVSTINGAVFTMARIDENVIGRPSSERARVNAHISTRAYLRAWL